MHSYVCVCVCVCVARATESELHDQPVLGSLGARRAIGWNVLGTNLGEKEEALQAQGGAPGTQPDADQETVSTVV